MIRYMTLMLFVLASCSQVHHASHQELEHELISSLENKQQKNSRQIRSFGSVDEAISFCIEHDQYDSDTLEYIALKLLQAGMQSEQAQDKLIGLYGIKIAQDERVEPLVAHAMKSQDPYVQLAALQVLGSYLTDESNRAIELALKSDFLLIRLEAAYLLAQRKLPKAYPQLESLFMKVPDEVRSYFPDLFALEGSAASRHMLKKMIHDLDMQVRKEAIFAASQASYHELVSDIQIYAEDIHPVIQEVFAYACQVFDLKAMVPQLKKIAHKRDGPQALMAAYTLYTFGDEQGLKLIEQEASKDNLYAMDLLGRMPGQATDLLMEKMHASDHNVRYNAALALLARKDPVCLPVIFSLLADTAYTCSITKEYSEGKTLSYFKLSPLTKHHVKENPYILQISRSFREMIITQALELPEQDFLSLCEMVFSSNQHDLIPVVCTLLENMYAEQSFHLLERQSKRLGDPFIRTFCTLILYRSQNNSFYAEKIKEYVKANQKEALIQVMPSLPVIEQPLQKNPYSLTLDERAQLLVECFSTLAMKQDREGIRTLLVAIRDGHPAHRPILAGLLLRASQ